MAWGQLVSRPLWFVPDFVDLTGRGDELGKVAAATLAENLTRDHEVLSDQKVRAVADELNIVSPFSRLLDFARAGGELRANFFVKGEVVDYAISLGGPARATVRLVAYRVSSGFPVGGATLVRDAVRRATVMAAEQMRGRRLPRATVVQMGVRYATIDRGGWSGFRDGMAVSVTRGPIDVAVGKITALETFRGKVGFERLTRGIAPGDIVTATYEPPALPEGP